MVRTRATRSAGQILRLWLQLHPAVLGLSAATAIALLLLALIVPLKFERRIATVERITTTALRHGPRYRVIVLLEGRRVSADLLRPTPCGPGDQIVVVQRTYLLGVNYTASTTAC